MNYLPTNLFTSFPDTFIITGLIVLQEIRENIHSHCLIVREFFISLKEKGTANI